jgi:alpha-glucosidase
MFGVEKVIFLTFIVSVSISRSQWYDGANFYQIYPRSFKDSDGDGVGDLQGIKSKLQYVKDLGIDGVWLSPIYKSPMADHGYDISDYRDIHHEFGTLQDFDELVNECNKLGLKLILDFVPNHSSDEHEWFKKSERREPGYEDYYIWRPAKLDPVSNSLTPPTNWNSAFRFSAWRYSDIRKEMYYHFFHYKQPDLNYRNPKLVQEMKDVLSYWMEKGVSGFRIDAIATLFEKENADGSFPNEERTYNPACDQYDECYLTHLYTLDQDECYDMVYQWRKLVDDFSASHIVEPKVLMTESSQGIDKTLRYYGNGSVEGSHIPFNFELLQKVNINSKAEDFKNIIEEWLTKMPAGHMANWVVSRDRFLF